MYALSDTFLNIYHFKVCESDKMPQPKLIENPEYAELFREVRRRTMVTTSGLMKTINPVERRNIDRKMNKMEKEGLITITKKPGSRENRYCFYYEQAAGFFWNFLSDEFHLIRPTKNIRLKKDTIDDISGFLKVYLPLKKVQDQKTIKLMFYRILTGAYADYTAGKFSDFDFTYDHISKAMANETYYTLKKELG